MVLTYFQNRSGWKTAVEDIRYNPRFLRKAMITYLLELNSESISKVERKLVNRSQPLFQWNLPIFWIFNWTSLTFFILRFPRHGNVTKFQNSPFLAISKTSSSCKCSQHLLWVVGRQVFEFSHRSFLDGFVELLSISTYNWLIQRLKIRALSNSRCANATKNFPTGEQQSRYNFFVQLKTFPIIMWFVTYLHLNILNFYKSDQIEYMQILFLTQCTAVSSSHLSSRWQANWI